MTSSPPLTTYTQITPFEGTFDEAMSASPGGRSPLAGARIMIVDDDAMMAEVVQAHLEDAGYSDFVVTSDPFEALDLLVEHDPAVLLLDLMMPGLSGFDILTRLRARPELRFLPVIVLTAATGSDSKLQALQLGATDFLAKPIDPSELVLRVRNTLAFRQFHERSVNYDALTGLPSRKHYQRLVHDQFQARPTAPADQAVCLNLGVPGARRATETFGQGIGDALVKVAAQRIDHAAAAAMQVVAGTRHAAPASVLGRVRTEQFGLVLRGFSGIDQVEGFVRQLLEELSGPVILDGQPYSLEPVAGVSIGAAEGTPASTLIEQAELARQQASAASDEQLGYAFYSPELSAQVAERRHRANELARALERGQMTLLFQIKVDMNSGETAGVEAELCWRHPEFGVQDHAAIADLARQIGIEDQLAAWVLQEACRAGARWQARGLAFGRMSVNVTRHQMAAPRFVDGIEQALLASGLPGSSLMLEVPDGALDGTGPHSRAVVSGLQSLGVALALDDFGLGSSSLVQLKHLPLAEIKVSSAFVEGVAREASDRAIVAAAIVLGHHLGARVVAMGVDDTEQLFVLHELSCDMQQGSLFCPPQPEAEVIGLLAAAGR